MIARWCAALAKTAAEVYFSLYSYTSDLGSGLSANWGLIVFAFWKSAKRSAVNGRHVTADGWGQTAAPAVEAYAAAVQLRDVDPVHSFTATEELRRQDPKYVQLWPSDIPHKRR
ncbi:hypothetical protein AU252_04645 [Pseudarthrobacter sulfonivorans]|uniref:Uncharacterized protein n=1 Tax=Pseudarthrobacter sulfonivorans TaxID=121292 RepID=A0A0U3Q8B3_9MICC|nr:hypothetical protein [Pseudarthrobacter sulfonivorans]ALV40541.1 hypothetical protein AU252_04645 [Pseudarthrobacter sulfonivorans]